MLMVSTPEHLRGMLQTYVDNRWDSTFAFGLYTNDFTPVAGMVLSDFDEPDDDDYIRKTAIVWNTPTAGADCAFMIAPILTWTFSLSAGSFFIRGYFVYEPDGDLIHWAQKLDTPVHIILAGQPYALQPRYDQLTSTDVCD